MYAKIWRYFLFLSPSVFLQVYASDDWVVRPTDINVNHGRNLAHQWLPLGSNDGASTSRPEVTPFVFPTKRKTIVDPKQFGQPIIVRDINARDGNPGDVDYCVRGGGCHVIRVDPWQHEDPSSTLALLYYQDADHPPFTMTMTPEPLPVTTKVEALASIVSTFTTTYFSYSAKPETTKNANGKDVAVIAAAAAAAVIAVDVAGSQMVLGTVAQGAANIPGNEQSAEKGTSEEGLEACELEMDWVTSAANQFYSSLRSMGEEAFKSLIINIPESVQPPTKPTPTQQPEPPKPDNHLVCGTDGISMDSRWYKENLRGGNFARFAYYGVDDNNQCYGWTYYDTWTGVNPDGEGPPIPVPDGPRLFFKIFRSNKGENCPPAVQPSKHGFNQAIKRMTEECASGDRTFGGVWDGNCFKIESWAIPQDLQEKSRDGLGWMKGS